MTDRRTPATLVTLSGLVAIVALLASLGPPSLDRSTVTMLINLVVVVGIYVFVGNSGVFSFGHIAFMAIGAYAGAILVMDPQTKELLLPELLHPLRGVHLPAVAATIAAGLLASLFALVVSLPLMRLSGLTAGLATFTLLIIVNVVASNWVEVTNGVTGISGIPLNATVPVALGWAIAALALAYGYQQTHWGRRLRASREDEPSARSIGVRIPRERRLAFCLSAFVVGVGGALFAQGQQAIQPDAFYTSLTFLTIAMLVVGGMTSLSGAVFGTILISAVSELLTRAESGLSLGFSTVTIPTGTTNVVLALVMLVVLLARPSGLAAGRELALPAALSRGSSSPPSPPPSALRSSALSTER